jgi:epoxyqueuosine reductase QueG
MKNKIFEYIHSIGIEKCGVTSYNGKSAIVCLFPYFTGFEEGNLSLYARSIDYHLVIKNKLSMLCEFIRSLSAQADCEIFADIGPEVDRQLAFNAGLGFYGKNGMLINDDFGSWFFIGYILCSLPLQPDSPLKKECMGCNKCIESCAGGALDKGFDISRCASHISQKKGDLTESEIAILEKSGLIFGCDVCQRVCPHNNITPKPMKEFTEDLIHSLFAEDIENLSNKEFMRKYKNRAFSWRGKNIVLRNLHIFKCL